jgi:hypothetical protein
MDMNAPGIAYSQVILTSPFSFVSKIAFEKGEEPPIAGKFSGHVNFLVSGRAGVLSTRKVAKVTLNNNDFCIT